MAAGLGFKDFVTGEVLTAADVDGYLMQGVWVFASATARDAAVTSPQEGNFAYLKDTNVTTYYTGSAWANLDTTGMTNPMTTTGDTIYSSSGSTPARLGIGTSGQVLQVNSGATAPEWATPAGGGGMTLLSTTTLSGTSTSISISNTGNIGLAIEITDVVMSADDSLRVRFNSDTGSNYRWIGQRLYDTSTADVSSSGNATSIQTSFTPDSANTDSVHIIQIPFSEQTASYKAGYFNMFYKDGGAGNPDCNESGSFIYKSTSVISNFTLSTVLGNSFSSGTVKVYGVK
jgi:hypothetical protein